MQRALPTVLLLIAALPVAAQELTLTVDVPSDLGGTTYLANQTVRLSQATYSLRFDGPAESLGPGVNINALVVLEDGGFLFSTDAPFTPSSFTYEARDVVRFDGASYSMYLDGGSLGLGPEADVDALARDELGNLVLSLDQPENAVGFQYMASDLLVVQQGDLSVLLSAATMGLPPRANVTGLEYDAAGWHMTFAEPTTAGTVTFLPGEIATWNGTFSFMYGDPAFPSESASVGMSFPGSPGDVEYLQVSKLGNDVELSWTASCSSESSDYAIYEGAFGDWAGPSPKSCGTSGATTSTIMPDPGDRFFLIVPRNGRYEGSYGQDSNGDERAAGLFPCTGVQRLGACS